MAKNSAFDVLFGSARSGLSAHRSEPATDEAVRALAIAGWSLSHGLATLALTANISEQIEMDPSDLAAQMMQGVIALAELAKQVSTNQTSPTPRLQRMRGEADLAAEQRPP